MLQVTLYSIAEQWEVYCVDKMCKYISLVVPVQIARDTKTIVMSYCVNTLKFEHYFTSLHINKEMITHSY